MTAPDPYGAPARRPAVAYTLADAHGTPLLTVNALGQLRVLVSKVSEGEALLLLLTDMVEQLEGNKVDLKKTPFMLGPKLTFDRKTEQFTGPHAHAANTLLKPSYRKPFVVPTEV